MFLLITIPILFLNMQKHEAPRLVEKPGEYSVELPAAMKSVLKMHDSTFVISRFADYDKVIQQTYVPTPHQLPFAVIGDFNGDGQDDIVLDGHTTTNRLLLIVLSSDVSYRVVEQSRSDYFSSEPVGSCLTFVPKGTTVQEVYSGPIVQLEADAFEWGSENASVVAYYKDGHFIEVVTGD